MEGLFSLLSNAHCLDSNDRCNFQKPLTGEYKRYTLPTDIHDIVLEYYSNGDKDPCPYCGYGDEYYYIIKFKDGNYGYIKLWSGCLTYSPCIRNNFNTYFELQYTDSYEDVLNLCMTLEDRQVCNDQILMNMEKYVITKK